MISPQRGHLTAGPRHLVIDTESAAGPRISARSVVMASSPHGTAHRAEHNQDEADDQQDETDRPQDRDLRDKAYDQQQNAQRDHERSFVMSRARRDGGCSGKTTIGRDPEASDSVLARTYA